MQTEQWTALRMAQDFPDARELGPLQLAYLGDTLHDLRVRSFLVARHMRVHEMHRQAVRLVSAGAQACMLNAIEPLLTDEEAEVARRGRNAQARHDAPRHADPADYAQATALEALWGWLFITHREGRMQELMDEALARTEAEWGKRH